MKSYRYVRVPTDPVTKRFHQRTSNGQLNHDREVTPKNIVRPVVIFQNIVLSANPQNRNHYWPRKRNIHRAPRQSMESRIGKSIAVRQYVDKANR